FVGGVAGTPAVGASPMAAPAAVIAMAAVRPAAPHHAGPAAADRVGMPLAKNGALPKAAPSVAVARILAESLTLGGGAAEGVASPASDGRALLTPVAGNAHPPATVQLAVRLRPDSRLAPVLRPEAPSPAPEASLDLDLAAALAAMPDALPAAPASIPIAAAAPTAPNAPVAVESIEVSMNTVSEA
ncbi:MAG: hypothetical protein M1457_03590, partial [bacterium]|nr:hypothetical protein [bacterium]